MRTVAAIVYEHISPHQAPALRLAASTMAGKGIDLLVVEQFGTSGLHGWTRADAPRDDAWICLSPEPRGAAWPAFRRLAALLRARQVDVTIVNGWSDPVSLLTAAAAPLLGTRVVSVVDSTERDHPRRASKEAFKRLFLTRVDAVFAAGTRQLNYLRRLGMPERRVTFGCDVVDNSMFLGIPVRSAPAPDTVVIGTAARLVPEKNLHAALLALASVASSRPAVKFVWRIVGRGPLAAELRQLADGSGVDVRFDGFVPYEAMPAFYTGLDLYWQPSASEPWGLAINEAMAAGLPILASDRCGCADDLLGPDNGWVHGLAHEQLVHGLGAAIDSSAAWPDRGAASRRRIGAWDLDRFAAGLLQAIEIARSGPEAATAPVFRQV